MKKVEVYAIDLGGKLREGVEQAFPGSPFIALPPVVHQVPQIRKVCPIVPTGIWK
jgi:hypothetical protein